MTGRTAALALTAAFAVAGCSGEQPRGRAASPSAAAAVVASASPSGEVVPGSRRVSARANIFGAGYDAPPLASAGGSGELPPVWALPEGSARTVTFPSVLGSVRPVTGYDYNGPDGDHAGPTDVLSSRGISGILHRSNGMFLAGVFLGDAPPASAPPRLDVTGEAPVKPLLGQTFLIGDGKGRSYPAPAGATRLFLGFADAADYRGSPGYYSNNSGELYVVVDITSR